MVKLVVAVLSVPLATLVVELTSVERISSSVMPLLASLAGSTWMRIDGRAVAEDRDLRDAGDLRNLLGQEQIGVFVDRGQRNGVGPQRQQQDRRVGRIDLLVARRRGHRLRQLLAGDRDRGLHVLRGRVDVAVEIELNDDRRGAERAQRRHLRDAGNLRELPLERRGDRGGDGFGAGALPGGGDLDGREIDLRQRRDRQERDTRRCRRRRPPPSAAWWRSAGG